LFFGVFFLIAARHLKVDFIQRRNRQKILSLSGGRLPWPVQQIKLLLAIWRNFFWIPVMEQTFRIDISLELLFRIVKSSFNCGRSP